MPTGAMDIVVDNYNEVIRDIRGMRAQGEKVVKRTVADFKKRAPAWVSQEVVKEYNIKKKEINSANKGSRNAGTIRVHGVKIDDMALVYQGRVLTPTHFGMTPKARPQNGRAYTVSATIKKGQKKVLGSKVFLAKSGREGTIHIPFQREGATRLPIKPIKTISIPQMITNDKVSENINTRINQELGKRLQHHMKQLSKRR